MKKIAVLLLVPCAFVLSICFWTDVSAVENNKTKVELSLDDQNRLALKAFEKILEITDSDEREKILPRLEEAYIEITRLYPGAHLTQEVYWRLMGIYLDEYSPPMYAKAEDLRKGFHQNFPESRMKDSIDRMLSDSYYRNGKWDKLLDMHTPSVKRSIETGQFNKIYDIFMYTEAKFGLDDFVEAEKGYKIVLANFPSSRESATAQKRLEEIEAKKKKK